MFGFLKWFQLIKILHARTWRILKLTQYFAREIIAHIWNTLTVVTRLIGYPVRYSIHDLLETILSRNQNRFVHRGQHCKIPGIDDYLVTHVSVYFYFSQIHFLKSVPASRSWIRFCIKSVLIFWSIKHVDTSSQQGHDLSSGFLKFLIRLWSGFD